MDTAAVCCPAQTFYRIVFTLTWILFTQRLAEHSSNFARPMAKLTHQTRNVNVG